MKIWIQLQKWFHPIVYACAVISSHGNLSTLLRNGTSEGVDFMRWGRKDGRTEWELCFVVTKVKLSIYLLAYLSHFYSERLICPPQWDEILSKVAYTMTRWWCHRRKHPGRTHGCWVLPIWCKFPAIIRYFGCFLLLLLVHRSRKHPLYSTKLNWTEIQTILAIFLGMCFLGASICDIINGS